MARCRDVATYDALIRLYSQIHGVPFQLVKGTLAVESWDWNPMSYKYEPPSRSLPDGGASFGLMQLLGSTARGLGYTGPIPALIRDTSLHVYPGAPTRNGLFDPTVSIDLGIRLLKQNLARAGGNMDRAVSAYNGGWRPDKGFGTPLADGRFGNQAYVDAVRQCTAHYATQLPPAAQADTAAFVGRAAPSAPVPAKTIAGILGSLLALLAWWLTRK
ncbi:MAG: transglycosylase SLT domain-containing protein [Burkholderiales bacterium]